MNHTCAVLTRSLLDLGDARMSLLQSLPAGGLQLAHVAVRLPVAAAHVVPELAPAEALGEPLAVGLFALQPVPAGQVLLAAARLQLGLRAHQAAVAAVGHVAAGAARTRTGTHIAARGTLGFRLCAGTLLEVQERGGVQQDLHFERRVWFGYTENKFTQRSYSPVCHDSSLSGDFADGNPEA